MTPEKPTIASGEIVYNDGDFSLLHVKVLDEGGGSYFQIVTEGWAFDTIQELVEVLEDAGKRLGYKV